jgi:hypothetical protein
LWCARVVGANVCGKFFVSQRLKVSRHFTETIASRRSLRIEYPSTSRAAPTAKARLVYPHQVAQHCGIIRRHVIAAKSIATARPNRGQPCGVLHRACRPTSIFSCQTSPDPSTSFLKYSAPFSNLSGQTSPGSARFQAFMKAAKKSVRPSLATSL